jgi:hypothetical protein
MLGDLKGVSFTGSAEIRVWPIGLFGDVLHVPVGANITTCNVFSGREAAIAASILTTRRAAAIWSLMSI